MMEEISFNPENHTYKVNNILLPSVTQIIQSAGLSDFSKVNPVLLEKAQLFGNAVHLMTCFSDKNILDEKTLDNNLKPYLNAWRKFKKDFGIDEFIEIEKQVYSKHYGYAGCLDRLYGISNKLTLIEIKTSTTIPITTGLQLAGYQIAYEEMTKTRIKERLCVQLLEGTYKLQAYNDRIDISAFIAALTMINWKKINNIKGKQNV